MKTSKKKKLFIGESKLLKMIDKTLSGLMKTAVLENKPKVDCKSESCSRYYKVINEGGNLILVRQIHYHPCQRAKKLQEKK